MTAYLGEYGTCPATAVQYRDTLRRFFADRTDPSLVTPIDVSIFVWAQTRRGRPPSPQTVRCRLAPVRGYYRRLVDWDMLTRSPCEGVRQPKLPRPIPRGLTAAQVRALLAATFEAVRGERQALLRGLRNRAAFHLLFLTGMRAGNVCGLTAGHLQQGYASASGGTFIVARVKGGRHLRIFLPPPCIGSIRDYLAAREKEINLMPADERIFGRLGIAALRVQFRKTAKAAGLAPATTHQARHSAAGLYLVSGLEPWRLRNLLGHENLATTSRYSLMQGEQEEPPWEGPARLIGII